MAHPTNQGGPNTSLARPCTHQAGPPQTRPDDTTIRPSQIPPGRTRSCPPAIATRNEAADGVDRPHLATQPAPPQSDQSERTPGQTNSPVGSPERKAGLLTRAAGGGVNPDRPPARPAGPNNRQAGPSTHPARPSDRPGRAEQSPGQTGTRQLGRPNCNQANQPAHRSPAQQPGWQQNLRRSNRQPDLTAARPCRAPSPRADSRQDRLAWPNHPRSGPARNMAAASGAQVIGWEMGMN